MDTLSSRHGFDRSRAILRTIVAALFTALTIAAVLAPTWVETAFGVEPDAGNGAFEWALVVTAGLAAIVSAWTATVAWRRVASSAR